jgi:DNA polymerase III subunit gamma/tau
MYLVLARKWRPQRFEDVVGQEHVTTTLRNAIAQQRIAHAFLFSGPRGVGKTTVARLLAKALNCEQGPTGEPCGKCSSCTEIAAGSALDVAEIDGASNTGVDNIRDLNENVRYRPASARFKIYIIDEVHMLSTAAFNALLKTLEEPPPHVKFIFATTEVQKLPQTVVSRCQRYEFKRIPIASLVERLRAIVADEDLEITDDALFAIAREADGSLRDGQSLLDQVIVFSGKKIGEEDVRGALGVADRTILHQVTDAILRRDPGPCLRAADELYRYGYEVAQFARDLTRQVRNLTVARLFKDPSLLTDLTDHEVKETLRQAEVRQADDLQRLFRLAQAGLEEVRKSVLPKIALEMTLVKMATMPEAEPIAALVGRLEELERRLAGGGDPPGSRDLGSQGRAGRTAAPSGVRRADAPEASSASTPRIARGDAEAQDGRPSPPMGRGAADPLVTSFTRANTAASTSTAASAARGSDPAAPAATADTGPVGDGTPWSAFLVAAQGRVSPKMLLAACRPVAESAEVLRIGVDSELTARTLAQRDNMLALQDAASRAYGAGVRVEVTVVKEGGGTLAERQAAEQARRKALTARAQASETLRTAVEILGGEITDVRPRPQTATEES